MSWLTRIAEVFRPKGAVEGAYRPGPYLLPDGWLPASWGKYLNFWQMGYDPLPYGGNSIVEACVWAYVRAIAQLPGYHRRELANGGTETITTSALSRLLRAPNGYQSLSDFLVHLIRSLLLTGNSYWIAQRNERNEVVALHWTDPRQCRAREIRIEGEPFAEVFYELGDNPLVGVLSITGDRIIIPARDVLHVKLATPRHPLVGETWLAALGAELAQTAAINASITTQAANTRPSGILTTEQTLTVPQVDELRARWKEQAATIAEGGVPILTRGLKFEPITMSAEDSKVIDQRKLNDQAVAAVFGVPAILLGLGGTASQKSSEAIMAEWLAAGLGWLINHIEVAIDQFIGLNVIPAGREWTELETRALLRSAFKERIDGLVRGVQGGVFSPNEARALEGYPAAEAGDEPRVQQQVVPLSFATTAHLAPPAPAPSLPAPAVDDEADEDGDDELELDEDTERTLHAIRIRRIIDAKRLAA